MTKAVNFSEQIPSANANESFNVELGHHSNGEAGIYLKVGERAVFMTRKQSEKFTAVFSTLQKHLRLPD